MEIKNAKEKILYREIEMKLEKVIKLFKLHKERCGEYACTESQFTYRAMFTNRIWSDEELIDRKQPSWIQNAHIVHKAKHGSKSASLSTFRGRILTQGRSVNRAISTATVINNMQPISIVKLHLLLFKRGEYNKTMYSFRRELHNGTIKLRDVATEDEIRMLALHKKNHEYI